jgi:serine/threonine-protein kinase
MGQVYEAIHVELRRTCVVKILHEKHSQRPEIVGRFKQEGRLITGLRHPSLPLVYDLGTTAAGQHYLAMEFLAGEDLRALLRRNGPLPVGEACDLAIQALDGLHVAHTAGVIHRDIKPENLFRTSTGELKILDFGIAKPLDEQLVATGVNTAFGIVLGTPRYMSPEQAKGNPLTHATDQYAIACVLFELIAGTPLVTASDTRAILRGHVLEPAPTLAQRTGRAFDPRLEQILARALAKDSAVRFGSAAEMAGALRPIAAAARGQSADPGGADTTAINPAYSKPTVRVDAIASDGAPVGYLGATSLSIHGATQHTAPTAVSASLASPYAAAPPLPPAPTSLPEGVIDHNLSSQALAHELLASRTTVATRRGSPLLVAFGVVGMLVFGGLAAVGVKSALVRPARDTEVSHASGSQVESAATDAAASVAPSVDGTSSAPPRTDPAGDPTPRATQAPREPVLAAAARPTPTTSAAQFASATTSAKPSASVASTAPNLHAQGPRHRVVARRLNPPSPTLAARQPRGEVAMVMASRRSRSRPRSRSRSRSRARSRLRSRCRPLHPSPSQRPRRSRTTLDRVARLSAGRAAAARRAPARAPPRRRRRSSLPCPAPPRTRLCPRSTSSAPRRTSSPRRRTPARPRSHPSCCTA